MMKKLYNIALLEDEGLGTAYEYYVKIRLLNSLLRGYRPRTVFVYGLPEKYGYSLDFFWLAKKWGAKTFVYEERMVKLKKCLDLIDELGWKRPQVIRKVEREYDMILSCEVLQSVYKERYANTVKRFSKRGVIFVPNANNKNHSRVSGLKGMSLGEIMGLFQSKGGYVDMPPFPPGVKSRSTKRTLLIWPLEIYGRLEQYLLFKNRCSHIIYATWKK